MAYRAKNACVYILASRRNGTLYIGVTSDLAQRVTLHKQDLIEGFTKKYGVHRLVYYEMHPTMDAAILREKRLKEWRRLWKIRSIESMKPRVDRLVRRTNGRDSRWSSRPVADSLSASWRRCAWVPCLRPTARCAVGLHGMTLGNSPLKSCDQRVGGGAVPGTGRRSRLA